MSLAAPAALAAFATATCPSDHRVGPLAFAQDDGTFWMPWDQFEAAGFTKIDICDRSTKKDLKMKIQEDWGMW